MEMYQRLQLTSRRVSIGASRNVYMSVLPCSVPFQNIIHKWIDRAGTKVGVQVDHDTTLGDGQIRVKRPHGFKLGIVKNC